MGSIVKALQSVIIALGIIAVVGTGAVLYYNVVNPPGSEPETEAAAEAPDQNEGTETAQDSAPETPDTATTEGQPAETAQATGEDVDATPQNGIETPLNHGNDSNAVYDDQGNIVRLNAPLTHKHQYEKVIFRVPTCTIQGEARYICSVCGEYYSEALPLAEHTPGEWITIKAATAASPAIMQKYCTVCGRAMSEQQGNGSSSSTTTQGNNTTGGTAGTGGGSTDPNHQHKYTYTISTKAECTKEGERTYTCTCGDTFKVAIPKLNHPSRTTRRTEGTCEKPGKIEEVCTECKEVVKTTEVIIPHSWNGWYTSVYPTALNSGTAERKCSRCGATETKVVPKLVGVDAYNQFQKDVIDNPDNASKIDPKEHPNHSYKLNQYKSIPANCSTEGTSYYECECEASYTVTTPKNPDLHNYVTDPNTNITSCTWCGTVK